MTDLRAALGIPWAGSYPHRSLVMGIVNATPDSFQPEGRHATTVSAIGHALRLVDEGADILDIGGESTRPGADEVPVEEELERVIPVIEGIRLRSSVPISVDTRKAEVARQALTAGAVMVNDVSAGRHDAVMPGTVASAEGFFCLMHGPAKMGCMRWSTEETPADTSDVASVARFLRERAEMALQAGVRRDRIIVDPGFGFGKTVAQNLALVRELGVIAALGYPVLIGVSRKSTVGGILDGAPPDDRVEGSIALAVLAVERGASMVRTHDVLATVRALKVAEAALNVP